jgi:hypothetical protein
MVDQDGRVVRRRPINDHLAMDDRDEIAQALARKGIEASCTRCGKDDWGLFSGDSIVPNIADQVEIAGGLAATLRVCTNCGCIELYNPGILHR